jgi:NhaA family Na+:H+ antiporter
MPHAATANRLDRPVDDRYDHTLGPSAASIVLVEYGSYACPHCRAANDRIAQVRDQFGDRLRYVFRHRPLTGSDIALRAAELAERAAQLGKFWEAHVRLMGRSAMLTEEDLKVVAAELGLDDLPPERAEEIARIARERVEADIASSHASGVMITPTFFINGRRYDGAWDESSFADALVGSLGHRVHAAALDFASWAPSSGLLLLLASVIAVLLTNSPWGHGFEAFWERELGISYDGTSFSMSLRDWVDDGLLCIFFLVVGLEIKREFTVGHLASRRSAALPVAAAIGGMAVPALIYSLLIPTGDWNHGWGVPMATDTAFAIALIIMLGRRVPIELRIFLTAAAIVDDIGAIVVVAAFYSETLRIEYIGAGVAVVLMLALLNRTHVYRAAPYVLLGVLLWACVHGSGLHSSLAGVVLAMFIPTRPPANLLALTAQADVIIRAEARRGEEVLRHGPSEPALRSLDAIHDRLESPADRMLRHVGPHSSYLVLPLFALANAGVEMSLDVVRDHEPLLLAIMAGLIVGKPLGVVGASAIAVALGIAVKPAAYSWRQLWGVGALAGIGFTMSLFIGGQAFPVPMDFAATKIAVFAASVVSAIIGVAVLAATARERGRSSDRMPLAQDAASSVNRSS